MSDFKSLLPSNTDQGLRDFEHVTARMGDLPVDIHTLWNPAECPAHLLGWLAWALSVDVWDQGWSEQTKRAVLAESVKVHRIKGTKRAVMTALAVIGFETEIREWFETGGEPHTFDVEAYANDIFEAGFDIGSELHKRLTRQIIHVKPVRSHFTLKIGEKKGGTIRARTASRQRVKESRSVTPVVPTDEHLMAYPIRTGHRQMVISRQTHTFQLGDAA